MASSARIEELTKKFEENPRRYFAPLANEYRKAGDLAQAISICRAHLPQQPGHMSGHVVFGQALFESEAFDEAKAVFETALQLDPENLIALRYLGDIALRMHDRQGARTWYQRALDVDPRNEEIQALLENVDGTRTPLASPAVPEPEREEIPAAPRSEATLEAEAPPLPGEVTPALLDAVSELSDEPILLEGFSAPGDELRGEESPADASPAGQPLEGLESTEFEATSLVDMVGASSQAPVSDEQSALLDLPDAVEPFGFEPTQIEADAGLEDLEREEEPFGTPASGLTGPLTFDEEPADSAPLQAGPSEEQSAPQLPVDAGDLAPVAEAAPAAESPTSLDTVPSQATVVDEAGEGVAPEGGAPAGFVTETMAELYLRQGHRAAALDVYRQLVAQSPEDERLRARVEELERAGEPSIRSFLAGIASRRPRGAAIEARDTVPAPSGEWMAVPSEDTDDAAAPEIETEVMGWRESNDVVSEIPLAAVAEAGELPGELPPAVLDGMEELTEQAAAAEPAPRRSPPFALDESAVPFDLPRNATPASPSPAVPASGGESIDALFGHAAPSAADDAAAATLAEAFAPVEQETPLAGRPAVPARDELSLDRVFRSGGDADAPRADGFSFDQFFGSPTPHAGSATVPPPGGSSPGSRTPTDPTPGSSQSPAAPDDIEQFNAWLQGLKKR